MSHNQAVAMALELRRSGMSLKDAVGDLPRPAALRK